MKYADFGEENEKRIVSHNPENVRTQNSLVIVNCAVLKEWDIMEQEIRKQNE